MRVLCVLQMAEETDGKADSGESETQEQALVSCDISKVQVD